MKENNKEAEKQRKYDSYIKSGNPKLRKKLREKPYALSYAQRTREKIDAEEN